MGLSVNSPVSFNAVEIVLQTHRFPRDTTCRILGYGYSGILSKIMLTTLLA